MGYTNGVSEKVTGHSDPLRDAVRRYCRDRQLLTPGTLVVAVSGGADSVCLLHILRDLAPEFGVTLHIAHFNHELRGKESELDAALVADLAERLDVGADFGTGDVGVMAASAHRSLEAVAHDMRWAFLDAMRQRHGAYAVATGHSADDQAETVLMHLLRGAGLRGLAGLEPVGQRVRRPLLSIQHVACVAWCREHGVHWREDASNLEACCRRNAVRLEVLPFLRRYNPAIDATLTGMAEAVQVDLAYLDAEATAAFQALLRRTEDGVEHLALAGYLVLHEAIRRQVLLGWLGANSRRAHVQSVDTLLRAGQAGDAVSLPGNRQVVKRYDDAILLLGTVPMPLPLVELTTPGVTRAVGWNWTIQTAYIPRETTRPANPWSIDLDCTRVRLPLTLRKRRPGDRLDLPGLAGPKKLQDLLVDAKMPRRERDRLGIIEAANGIVWLAGWRAAAWATADADSERVLRLTVELSESQENT